MATINEIIQSAVDRVKLKGSETWIKWSFWTRAKDVELNSGKNVETAVSELDENISNEIDRATDRENEIETALNSEITRAKSAESTLSTSINNEITRAKNAENTLETNKVPITRTINGKALSSNITLSASDVGADASGSANTALTNAKAYADTKVADLVNSAPETLDTLGEIADALKDNADIVDVLNESIATKANASDLTSHTGNTTVHITSTERTNWNDANSKKHTHSNKSILDGITSALVTAWNNAHSHISDSVKHITADERNNWNAKASKYGWTATVKGQTWSRILQLRTSIPVIGTSGILNVSFTRGGVVSNATFMIVTSHKNKCNITQVNSSGLSSFKIRGVADTNGFAYIELYDYAGGITADTEQKVYCEFIPLRVNTVNVYKEFTDGTTVPDGYTANNPLSVEIVTGGSMVASKFVGDLEGNSNTATTLATARTINDTDFDGSADIRIANSYNFKFSSVAAQRYFIFAKLPVYNPSTNEGATLLVTDTSNFANPCVGTYIVQIANRSGSNSVPNMYVRQLVEGDEKSKFGYYIADEYIYFGVYCPQWSAGVFVTVLSKREYTEIGTLQTLTTKPDTWVEISNGYTPQANASDTVAGIGKLYTATGTGTDGSMTQSAITSKLGEKASLVSPALTGTPTAPTASTGTNTTQIATTAFVQTAVSNGIAASDAMIVKGTIGTSGTVTTLPTTYSTGWTYRVVTAGTYAGQVCEIGDLIIALVDRKGTGNTNSDWCVAQTNINGAITGVKSGDAYIDYSQSGSVVTITHKNVTRTNTTSTSNPTHGGTFTAVKSITSDEKGHVTGVDTETVKLPNAYTHPSYTARTGVPTANQTPTFGGTFSITQPVSDATGHITAMNSRTITIPNSVATTSAPGLMSTSDKTKLDGIATSAEVNQNAFSNVVVGSTTIAADSKTDSLTLAGSNVTLTPDATNDKVTIGITKANVTSALGYTPPTTDTTYGVATSSALGLVKSGTDITVDSFGNVSVNDDSHNHTIANVDNLQTTLDAKASKYGWTATVKGQTWSRILQLRTSIPVIGTSGILNVSFTRGGVVSNATFMIVTSHKNKCNITQVNSSGLSSFKIRGVADTNGFAYIELYDYAGGITADTEQKVYCEFIPLRVNTVNVYKEFTDGTTVPDGYTANNPLSVEIVTGGSMVASKFVGDLEGNSDTTTALKTPVTINGTSFDGSANIRTADSWNFSFGGNGTTVSYRIFAKMAKTNTTGNEGATFLITDGGNFDNTHTGAWLVQVTNRGSKASMYVRVLESSSDVTFGYWSDDNYYYFGAKCAAYSAGLFVTVLSNRSATIGNISTLTTQPSNWTGVDFLYTPQPSASTSTAGIGKLYTATGTGTDGSMTQSAITEALNGKAASSHTHNYAGSSSAGGAATTALACTGNSATATKATQDASGNVITSTYALKSLYGDDTINVGRASGSTVGMYSTAEGCDTTASGYGSHAEGNNTTANGSYSHAEGSFTTANGSNSHAEGDATTASKSNSHAEGYATKADGSSSHAEGYNTIASGQYSHAEGNNTTASGKTSHAEGYYATALAYQHAQGHYNNTSLATAYGSSGTSTGTAFVIGNGTSTAASNAFRVTGEGITYAKGAYNTSGADYAEFAEWADGNTDNEDRRGYFVTFDEEKTNMIRKANEGDYILGIVSGNPCIIGNSDEGWLGQYVFDEFGAHVYEEVEEQIEYVDEDTGEIKTKTELVTTYKLNPDYDPERGYTHRKDRQEWDYVGWMGVLSVRDDNTCIPGGYCKVADGGIATGCERGVDTYRVLERVNDNIVKVALK